MSHLVLIAILLIGLFGITGLYHIFDARPTHAEAKMVTIVIEQGASLGEIASQLEAAGVISSAPAFTLATGLLKRTRSIYPGQYMLETGMSNTEAIDALSHAKAVEITVTIPEGLRSDEIIGLLSRKLDLDSLKMTALLTDSSLLAIVGPEFSHLEGTLFRKRIDSLNPVQNIWSCSAW